MFDKIASTVLKVVLSIILLGSLLVATGIATISYLLRTRVKDVSATISGAHNHTFELRQDVFLYYHAKDADTKKNYILDGPSGSMLPASIEDYRKDPENWPLTDANAKQGMGPERDFYKAVVKDVIKKGTQLKIIKITLSDKPLVGRSLNVLAEFTNDSGIQYTADIRNLVANTWDIEWGKSNVLQVKVEYLLDSALIKPFKY